MKLKRILLRYHPPGIGLECIPEGDGEVEVIHKDLPPAEQVASLEAIQGLVINLLDEETLLQKKKHEKSLTQLLGRLYQIDTDAAVNEGSSAEAGATYQEGQKVACVGFSGSNATYNGAVGTVTRVFDEKKTKYEVTFDNGTVVKVKENHILHVMNDGYPFRPGLLPTGVRVVITGLRNHGTLNGTVGRVVDFAESTSRYEVRAVETGQLFRVKPDNILVALMPDEDIPQELAQRLQELGPSVDPTSYKQTDKPELTIPVGAVVELVNLRNAGWLNGQLAEVLSVDYDRRRYEIRLNADDSIKKVKAENVVQKTVEMDPSRIVTKGARIELCNLKTAAALNGERAVVILRDGDRYEIRLELDGSTKQVKRDNFKVIGQPMQ
ncbi:unnamed protein product [Amoebophrya sp. A25]|nr:unnamed protein product [Amoebophrya sp. A25]|eukprot:GSA25T00003298001.1